MTQDEIIWQNEVLEMARQAGFDEGLVLNVYPNFIQRFAKLVAAKEREHYEGILTQICVQCRSNEWGPLTHKKEILNWFHDFAANALERGEA